MMPDLSAGRAVLSAAVFFVIATPGYAGSCGYAFCWGAVAAGENGIAARASGLRTAPDAWAHADRVCQNKCSIVEVFNNGCGAIVQDSDGVMSSGFSGTRSEAEKTAMAACEKRGGTACRVRVWACSN